MKQNRICDWCLGDKDVKIIKLPLTTLYLCKECSTKVEEGRSQKFKEGLNDNESETN